MSKESAMLAFNQTPEQAPATVVAAVPEIKTDAPAAPQELNSDRFAHLAKKEAKLQKDREAFKAEQKATAEAKAKYEAVEKQYKEFETLRQSDPIAAMKLAGFSDTDIFNYYANAEKEKASKDTPEAKAAAAAQAEIKKFQDAQAKKAEEDKAAADAATIKRFQESISSTITSDKEKYEWCNYHGPAAEQLIYATVEEVLKESGEVISAAEAADMVEKFYEDEDKAKDTLKKRAKAPAAPEAAAPTEPPPVQKSKTLTNKVAPTVGSTISKRETHSEKKARLIKQIQEQGLRK